MPLVELDMEFIAKLMAVELLAKLDMEGTLAVMFLIREVQIMVFMLELLVGQIIMLGILLMGMYISKMD